MTGLAEAVIAMSIGFLNLLVWSAIAVALLVVIGLLLIVLAMVGEVVVTLVRGF